jgi:hypothetical protein
VIDLKVAKQEVLVACRPSSTPTTPTRLKTGCERPLTTAHKVRFNPAKVCEILALATRDGERRNTNFFSLTRRPLVRTQHRPLRESADLQKKQQ